MADSASTPSSTSSITSSITSSTTSITVSSGTHTSISSSSLPPSSSSSTSSLTTSTSSSSPSMSTTSTTARTSTTTTTTSATTTSSTTSTTTTPSTTSTTTTPSTTSTTTTPSTTSTTTTSTSDSTTSSTTSSVSSSTTSTTSIPTSPPSSTSTSSTSSLSPPQPSQISTTLPPTVHPSTSNPPTTTFESIHFVTTTDHQGEITTTAPSIITTILTSTASNGGVVTITQVGINQTLSPNNSTSSKSAFFRNTGAVAGVFVLVGLAAASILLWILFAIRRRRRTQRLEHDTAVSATLAAAGFHRTPLDDDDDQPGGSPSRSRFGSPDIEMNQRTSAIGTSSSVPSAGRASAYIDAVHPDEADPFNPYTNYSTAPGRTRRTSSPPPVAFYNGPYRDRTESGSAGDHVVGHSATHSAGSYEPLLASFPRSARPSSPVQSSDLSNSRPRHSHKLPDSSQPLIVLTPDAESPLPADNHITNNSSSRYSSESVADDRLDPGLRLRLNAEADRASARDLRDDEDYSRPVLGIRNMPDATSQLSQES